MKTLIEFCKKYNLAFREVIYKSQGMKLTRKGYDIYNPETKYILVRIEPKYYATDKWLVNVLNDIGNTSLSKMEGGILYLKSLNQLPNKVQLTDTTIFTGSII